MSGDNLIDPKKRMEELSVAYVHAVASHCGYDANRPQVDHDSVDIIIKSSAGKKPSIDVQLKATTKIGANGPDSFSFPLPIKNYDDLRGDNINPRILIVLCMPSQQDDWIMHTTDELALRKCAYWVSLRGLPDTTNKESVSINIPAANAFSPQALNDLMQKADRREDL
ncbi:MAG: DUF4365 domain-containing protein [Alphaproteobacteria bacterium]|nr:DUF4365 domain-containing protein [Alphaproteobacteria bacterium]